MEYLVKTLVNAAEALEVTEITTGEPSSYDYCDCWFVSKHKAQEAVNRLKSKLERRTKEERELDDFVHGYLKKTKFPK